MSEAEAVWFGGVVARIWFYGAFPALLVVSFVKFRNHDGDDDTGVLFAVFAIIVCSAMFWPLTIPAMMGEWWAARTARRRKP